MCCIGQFMNLWDTTLYWVLSVIDRLWQWRLYMTCSRTQQKLKPVKRMAAYRVFWGNLRQFTLIDLNTINLSRIYNIDRYWEVMGIQYFEHHRHRQFNLIVYSIKWHLTSWPNTFLKIIPPSTSQLNLNHLYSHYCYPQIDPKNITKMSESTKNKNTLIRKYFERYLFTFMARFNLSSNFYEKKFSSNKKN